VSEEQIREQRETLGILQQALDIGRAEQGARILYPWQWNEDACPEVVPDGWRAAMALPRNDPLHRTEKDEDRRRFQQEQNQAAIALLRSWRDGDDEDLEEQRAALEGLRQALSQDRLGYRKLF
jgi:hypothetical protein